MQVQKVSCNDASAATSSNQAYLDCNVVPDRRRSEKTQGGSRSFLGTNQAL